ncbi:multidrug efflux transporter AcrB transmembrane domain-containing protein [Schizopora paradoxa]|uniref:Multidrug efflux transporter AcrB transmembrane domain-containing protein n=1 Tax=Schizopora paradoxa TaxID=27342 RepID=A0A0H2RW78_9AGAM|nr:multidrug efflux transporter AcrB transmembrane domain-containing protein [Schizopora paradoxa]
MEGGGSCALRGSCGTKSGYGKSLPCPYDGPPQEPETEEARDALIGACGEDFAHGPVCCTSEQVETLHENLKLAENFISSCPACRNNFRSFFCSFTCSPNQGSFVNVTATQESYSKEIAVKSVDFFVGETFANGFFNSCKDVQFGVANDFAMNFIGNGAKNASAFLAFLGHEEPFQGSPFQIDFPSQVADGFTPHDPRPRNCADNDLQSRCTCIDCPRVCEELPPVPPIDGSTCRVGSISCLSFALTNIYAVLVVVVVVTYFIRRYLQKDKKYERLDVAGEDPSDNPLSPRSHSRSLVGATSLHHAIDREESLGGQSGDSRHLGRGASLLDPIETIQPRQYRLNVLLRKVFYRLGLFCARYIWLTFAIVFAAMGLLNIGWKYFEIETDPVRLWVAPNSESKLQKEFFDNHFGPFYRLQQIFVTVTPQDSATSELDFMTTDPTLAPVLNWEHLKWWFSVEEHIRTLQSPSGTSLSDICFSPTGRGGPCVVQSITGWFGEDPEEFEQTWRERIAQCSKSPTECLPDFMQPLPPQNILGGLPDGSNDWREARALAITFLVDDSLDDEVKEIAMEWERVLRTYLLQLSESAPLTDGLDVFFSTGVSLEEELNKSTNMDVKIVVLSYIAMFFYVALTLGNRSAEAGEKSLVSLLVLWVVQLPAYFKSKFLAQPIQLTDSDEQPRLLPRLPRNLFVNSKFTLGLFGIAMVILSVSSSVGLFSLLGVKVTLIIAEVIPFLVLAVGVDNVFILVHELDRQNMLHGPNASTASQNFGTASTANTIANTARPSPYASSHEDGGDALSVPIHFTAEERIARALAKMGPSILLSSITETAAFALGALVPMPAVRNFALYAAGSVFLNAILQVTVFVSALTLDLHRIEASRVDCFPCIKIPARIALPDGVPVGPNMGSLARFIRRRYAPLLLQPVVKGFVLLLFSGIFLGSIISMQHIQLGLDQRLALPAESYLIPYFDALDSFLDVGPPVYFVSSGVNVTSRDEQRHLCGRFTTCDPFSLANVLEMERKREDVSFISQPTASWVDDFLNWLDPLKSSCCRVRKRNPDMFCGPRESARICRPCLEGRDPTWNITMEGFPEGEEFEFYLKQWLKSPSDAECPLGGQAGYSAALSFDDSGAVSASHFRTFHSPLKSQADFINSLSAARRIADDISQSTGTSVFPYSIHYVFFDQYEHIIAITQEILGLGLAAVLVINALLLGSWRTGTIVTGVVALTVVTVMGVMGLWGIDLNAISLVNLVISLGIAVEFCAHVARAFMGAGTGMPVDHLSGQRERDERMYTALVDVGPSVLSGITFTKLIGISVLALTRSKLLKTYYFRMWLTLIISGALHGLVLLPVVLSLAGGPGYALEDVDEEWMSSSIRRRDYEYTPFLADDDDTSTHSG